MFLQVSEMVLARVDFLQHQIDIKQTQGASILIGFIIKTKLVIILIGATVRKIIKNMNIGI